MKKTISFILIVCLIAGLFSGCIFKSISVEEDIKVWTQYSDSNVRTFYKSNGEIDHTEVVN